VRRLSVALILLIGIGAVGLWWWAGEQRDEPSRPVPGEAAPYVVEVLNGTDVDGLARAMTRRLRARGIDVVYFGTAPFDTLATTQIVVRRGDSTAAVQVLDALGIGALLVDEDLRLLLDASVYLGRDAAGLLGLDP
jgi:hypothetical protein